MKSEPLKNRIICGYCFKRIKGVVYCEKCIKMMIQSYIDSFKRAINNGIDNWKDTVFRK